MRLPAHFLIEGIDRVGKDLLIEQLQQRLGYHRVLHFSTPRVLECYGGKQARSRALQQYQDASFRTMFEVLSKAREARIICNRSHLGEYVYAPLYREYPGEYVFELEHTFRAAELTHVRVALLLEDFGSSRHFVDDGKSLGRAQERPIEQSRFLEAFVRSAFQDKRTVCVTDRSTGQFRSISSILDEVVS